MHCGYITRPALGSFVPIGQIYDARLDQFLNSSVFKREVPKSSLNVSDNHFSDIQLIHSDDFSEKFHKLDVTASLQVSVLCGLVSLEASARYLQDQKKSARTVNSSLLYNIKTKNEELNVFHEDLKEVSSLDAVKYGGGTHMVVGVSWGANCVLTCKYNNKEERDTKEIKGQLSATLQKLTKILSISGKAEMDFKDGDGSSDLNFEIKIYGDILPSDNEPLPTTVEGGLQLMTKLPLLIKNCNEGKGKPLNYRLVPLSLLQSYLNFTIVVDTTLRILDEASLLRVVRVFEDMSRANQKLNDFYFDIQEHPACISNKEFNSLTSFKDEVAIQESKFRSELSQLLVEVRSGKDEMKAVEELLSKFRENDFSPYKIEMRLTELKTLPEKIKFVKELEKIGGNYVGYGDNWDEVISNSFDAKSFVLYFNREKAKDIQIWAKNRQIFWKELKTKREGCVFYAVDCDFHPELMPESKTSCVQIVKGATVISEDYLAELEKIRKIPMAFAPNGRFRTLKKPNKSVPLTLRCTGFTCDPDTEYEWKCKNCSSGLEWGFDEYVYCRCGKTPALSLEFKCTHSSHSVSFEKHEDESYMKELLSKLNPVEEMNRTPQKTEEVLNSEQYDDGAKECNGKNRAEMESKSNSDGSTKPFVNFDLFDTTCYPKIPNKLADLGIRCTGIKCNPEIEYTWLCWKCSTQLRYGFDYHVYCKCGKTDTNKLLFKCTDETHQNFEYHQTPSILQGLLSKLIPNKLINILILGETGVGKSTWINAFYNFITFETLNDASSHDVVLSLIPSKFTVMNEDYQQVEVEVGTTPQTEMVEEVTIKGQSTQRAKIYAFPAGSTNIRLIDTPGIGEYLGTQKDNEFQDILQTIEQIKELHGICILLKPNNARLSVTLRFFIYELLTHLHRDAVKNIVFCLTNTRGTFYRPGDTFPALKMLLDEYKEVPVELSKKTIYCFDSEAFRFLAAIKNKKTVGFSEKERANFSESWDRSTAETKRLLQYICTLQPHPVRSTINLNHIRGVVLKLGWPMAEMTRNLHTNKAIVKAQMTEIQETFRRPRQNSLKEVRMKEQEKLLGEYDVELSDIKSASVKFACFLKKYAITPYNDEMERRLNYLISVEENKPNSDKSLIDNLTEYKLKYLEEKNALIAEVLKHGNNISHIGLDEITETVNKLKSLKHSGKSLSEALQYKI